MQGALGLPTTNIPEYFDRMTSKQKRRHVDSSSSSDSPSVDGTDVWRRKKPRAQRRLDHSLKELKEEMTQMKEKMTRMKMKMTRMKEKMTQIGLSEEDFQRKVTEQINELKDAILLQRPSPTNSKEENIRNLKLQCKTKLAQRVYTGRKLAGDHGTGIQIILIDADTNQVITTGIESSIKVDAVVLEGDFNREDHENWPQEEFDGYIVKERPHRRPLLIGELQVALKEGAGSLNDLTFTDNSSWNPSKMFRIGVRVASGYCEGTRIREALTNSFSVVEHRGESYMKHHPPESSDCVWRLEYIRKDGPFHKRLNEVGINNVGAFLQAYSKDQQALKNILGNGMTAKKWDFLIDHAKTCRLSEKSVSDSEKQEEDGSVKIAHQNWKDGTEYAGLHGPDLVIGRSIIPCPAAPLLPENHHEIPSGHSFSPQDLLTQIPAGLAGLHMGNAGSSVATEQGSMSQQIVVQAGETSTPHQPVRSTSSSSVPPNFDKLFANSPDGSFLKL